MLSRLRVAFFWGAVGVFGGGCQEPAQSEVSDAAPGLVDTRVEGPDGDRGGLSEPPAAPVVSISPAGPGTLDDLTAVVAGRREDLTYGFEWFREGVVVADLTAETVPAGRTQKGEGWQVLVTARRGARVSIPGPAEVVIGNTAPRCEASALTPDSGDVRTAFACVCEGRVEPDDGDPALDVCVFWVDGAVLSAEGCTLAAGAAKRGQTVTCTLTPTDGEAQGAAVASDGVLLANSPPSGGVVTVSPDAPTEESVLECVAGGATDPDGDSVVWSVAWRVDGAPVAAAGALLTGADFDRGQTVSCVATPSDGSLAGAAVAAENEVVIGNSPPVLSAVTATPGTLGRRELATCEVTAPVDVDPADAGFPMATCGSVAVAWLGPDDALLAGAETVLAAPEGCEGWSAPELVPAMLLPGDALRCRAVPTDGLTVGEAVLSAPIVIVNRLPTVGAVTVSPAEATALSTLSCEAAGVGDPDEDPVSLAWAWTKNGETLAAAHGETLAGAFAKGDQVSCRVIASDEFGEAAAVSAVAVTIGDAPAVVLSVALSWEPPIGSSGTSLSPCSAVSCDAEAVDPDGDPVGLSYAWSVDGAPVAGEGAALSAALAPGQIVTCVASVGGSAKEASMAVVNVAPTVAEAVLLPAAPGVGDPLSCVGVGFVDPDCGVSPEYTVRWFVDGAPLSSASALETAELLPGAAIQCALSPTDGWGFGPEVFSKEVALAAVSSKAPTVTVSAPAGAAGAVSCPVVHAGEGEVSAWFWSIGGQPEQPGPETLPAPVFSDCDRVTCRAEVVVGGLTFSSNLAAIVLPVGADCDDKNPCTEASCHPAGGCLAVPVEAACDDGALCTAGDVCVAGGCVGAPDLCDDQNPCTDDYCDPVLGCLHSNNAAACDADQSVCTAADHCAAGVCAPGAALVCDDGSGCTLDGCDPLAGCTTAPVAGPCEDDNPCTVASECVAGTCVGEPVAGTPDCGLGDGIGGYCAAGACQANIPPLPPVLALLPAAPVTGQSVVCVASAVADPDQWPTPAKVQFAWRVDGDPVPGAFSGTLDGSAVVVGTSLECEAFVSDGAAASAPTSVSVTVANAPPSVASVALVGPAPSGQLTCEYAIIDPDDANLTVAVEWRRNGMLVSEQTTASLPPGVASACDRVTCRVIAVDPAGGQGSAQSSPYQLPVGVGCGSVACQYYECLPTGGCLAHPADGPCDDGDPCTAGGTCVGGGCQANPLPASACDDQNPCTTDSCAPGLGCQHLPSAGPCDADGSACTASDACQAGTCVPGPPLDCSDGIACTPDICDPVTGCLATGDLVEFPLTVGQYGGPSVFIESSDEGPNEIIQGAQGGVHINVSYRLALPAATFWWEPLRTSVTAELRTPCCDGELIASYKTSAHFAFKITEGVFMVPSLPFILGYSAAPYVGKTACAKITVGVWPQESSPEPLLESVDRHVFLMVDEVPNG